MWSLFSTDSSKAGFRLQYMEVFNWGTFDKKVYRINPQGNNSLLTGANASGKSTYIDALLTLMVPLKRNRYYNQSSGVEKKGDRTEETYVLGHYGNILQEGAHSVSTQKLRDQNTYSVLLASFSNSDMREITLFQVRWFANGELKRQFGIAHLPLTIENDFNQFDAKGNWKKMMDKVHNSRTNKRRVEFIDGPTAYAERMTHLFGMRSTKALSLFNQVVGVKVLDDLDDFIRLNMLEDQDAEAEFIQLKMSFDTLIDAQNNIEKAKEQIAQLKPIDAIARQIQKIREQLGSLHRSKQTARYWFAQKGIELGEKELQKCREELNRLSEKLSRFNEQEEKLKADERRISISIETDAVGNQIRELEKEIRRLERERDARTTRLDEYNGIAQKIEFEINPNESGFYENREKAKALKLTTQQNMDRENKELRSMENEGDRLQQETEELVRTIQTLQKNKNNIAGRPAEIREEILEHLGIDKEELPFIGELIRVKHEDQKWEAAIEKVLRDFALHMLVPTKFYADVNQYVDARDLQGKIRFHKYEEQDYLQNFRQHLSGENSLVRKVSIKPRTKHHDWIENQLMSRFDIACVEDLTEFGQYSEKAVTINGLTKWKEGKHEKDDRPLVSSRENYVLGWDNKEKIAMLRQELNRLQSQQKENNEAIRHSHIKIGELNEWKDECHNLFSRFHHFEDINWQSPAGEIQEKSRQKEALEKQNDKIRLLKEELEKVQSELRHLTDVKIKNTDREVYRTEDDLGKIENSIKECSRVVEESGAVDVSEFEARYPDLMLLEYPDLGNSQRAFLEENADKTARLQRDQQQNEAAVRIKINGFKQPGEEITARFRDWRSDVSALPDSTHLELISEYQDLLQRLEKDNLPRFEKKFNDYLQETITHKVGDFRMFFENWSDSIRDNIQFLNESLKEIDFKNNPKTYIHLVARTRVNEDVREFRRLLEQAIPNIQQIQSNIDGRKNHFVQHIHPFIKKLENETWRREVMDVRSWYSYKAEEFYKENDTKFKTYESMGQLSGGEKAQLTYTILGSAIAYQFGLTREGMQSKSFRFIAIDEAFKAQDEDKARYLISLCRQLHLQLLVVTPSDNIHIVENEISYVHFVERRNERESVMYDMPIEQFREEKAKYLVS